VNGPCLALSCWLTTRDARTHRNPIRTKAANELSSPNSEKSPRKLRELMKRSAGFMAKVSAIAMMRIGAAVQIFLCYPSSQYASNCSTRTNKRPATKMR